MVKAGLRRGREPGAAEAYSTCEISERSEKVKETASPLTVVEAPIDELRPDPANPRRISDAQIEALTRSIREYGFVQPILARSEDKTVIGGHQRLVAARRLGYKTVPVVFLDITLEQARLLNLGLNKISGDWDNELLGRLLADLSTEDVDLSLSGLGEDEVAKLLKSLDHREKRDRVESFDLDAALETAGAGPTRPTGRAPAGESGKLQAWFHATAPWCAWRLHAGGPLIADS
jgi:ParB-like chromosome segregation protein Spo0J